VSCEPKSLTPQRFRKKPVVIEAVQFRPDAKPMPPQLARAYPMQATAPTGEMFEGLEVLEDERGEFCFIQTLEGFMRLDPGDWLITGVKGERYPCKPDIFAATYEPVGAPVVARDEAAELRAENERLHAGLTRLVGMLDAANRDGALIRLNDISSHLRRLAASEGQP